MASIFGGAEVSNDKIPTAVAFSKNVELYAIEKETTVLEAIIEYCGAMGIELEEVSKLITPPLKEKIRVEAATKRLIKDKITKLPLC